MATQLETPALSFDVEAFEAKLPPIYRAILEKFCHICRSYIAFHISFFLLFVLEIALFSAWICLNATSLHLAASCAILFSTGFAYLTLLFYFQTKKPQQIIQLKDRFLLSCKRQMTLPEKEVQHHLFIAEALTKLSLYLEGFEGSLLPAFFQGIIPQKFSKWVSFEDLFFLKEHLLFAAANEHLMQIRTTPTDLEVHACLANTYVLLFKLYRSAIEERTGERISQTKQTFEYYAKLAIEEFKILNHYAPHDPWVHEQLAMGYKELQMPEEEVKEVEILRSLKPHDREILFRLGILYFQQGHNAKGLQTYEELKSAHYQRAQDLVSYYGKPRFEEKT